MFPDSASNKITDRLLLTILQLGGVLCFAGWAWEHYYWEGPYGDLIWNDATFELAQSWGFSWEDFVGSGYNDGLVQLWLGRVYLGYVMGALACATASLGVRSVWFRAILIAILIAGSGLLLVLTFAKYARSDYELPMLVEHGGQVLMPILLVNALVFGPRHRITIALAICAVVATFAGHGAYALGLYPTPPQFIGMTTVLLGWEYSSVMRLLWFAGLMDFVVCIGLFTPLKRWSVAYGVLWGLLTSLARPLAGMSWELSYWGADQYLHEAIYRAPHFMIPAFLLVYWTLGCRTSIVADEQ